MSGQLRTTTIVVGPFTKPLSPDLGSLVANFVAKAMSRGYACARLETETSVSVTAVQSAPPAHPFTRVRELVPGAVVTALVGEATASHQD